MNEKEIIVKTCSNGVNKYYCPHCNKQLSIQRKLVQCRNCGGIVSWKSV